MSLPMQSAKYFARACGAAQFEQSSNGNMQSAIPLEIVVEEEGQFVATPETITWYHTLHDTADKTGRTGRDRYLESLMSMGWQGEDLLELVEISDDAARALMPEVVEIVVEPDTYGGQTRLKVKWVNKRGSRGGFKEPMSKDALRGFAAQMRSTVKGVRASTGAPRPASTPQQSRSATSGSAHPNAPGNGYTAPPKDDIPFASCELGAEPSAIARVLQ